jgi:hypothetical protein
VGSGRTAGGAWARSRDQATAPAALLGRCNSRCDVLLTGRGSASARATVSLSDPVADFVFNLLFSLTSPYCDWLDVTGSFCDG